MRNTKNLRKLHGYLKAKLRRMIWCKVAIEAPGQNNREVISWLPSLIALGISKWIFRGLRGPVLLQAPPPASARHCGPGFSNSTTFCGCYQLKSLAFGESKCRGTSRWTNQKLSGEIAMASTSCWPSSARRPRQAPATMHLWRHRDPPFASWFCSWRSAHSWPQVIVKRRSSMIRLFSPVH